MRTTLYARTALSVVSLGALLCATNCGGGAPNSAPVAAPAFASSGSPSVPGIRFRNSSNPPTSPYPQSVAVADFNGDGKLDMAVPVYSIGTPTTDVNIFLGNGNGTFKAGPAFPLTGQNVNNVAVGDFNGDGKIDLAISMPDAGEIQVLLGNGDGSFTPLAPISVPAGVFKVGTCDFNGDGKLDLVVTAYEITVLLGNGDGTFTAKPSIPITGGAASTAVGDFNGDGIADLAVADNGSESAPSSVTILLGKGDGTFTQVPESPATGIEPLAIAVGDFNGDGILDLAVTNQNDGNPIPGTVTILIGKGNGFFRPTAVSPQTGPVPYSVAVADFNGDGKLDLAVANAGNNTITILLGKGDGSFASPVSPATGTDPVFAAVGDFNGDGVPDLAAACNTANIVTVLLTHRAATEMSDRRDP
jgi:hypothetical protein